MKVILLQNVEKLGKKREVKEVTNGYARNFLIPRKLAVLASQPEIDRVEKEKELEAQKAEEELIHFQELASQVDGLELEIFTKVSEEGKLFGAITSAKIAEVLAEKSFQIKKEQIKLDEPIKELGEYEIIVELPHNLEAKFKIFVVKEEEKDK